MSINNIQRPNAQACAACKYQRRKCAPDCILAPYFPHDRLPQFLNAHKLFGVSNITKIIRNLNQPHKDEAMRTIIIQSDVRARDPVGGCYRIIWDLQRLIEFHRAELDLVLHQLALCREQVAQHQQEHILMTDPIDDPVNYHNLQSHHEQDILQNEHVSLHEWAAMQDPTLSSLELKQPSVNECNDFKNNLVVHGDRNELKFEPEENFEGRFEQLSLSLVPSQS